MRPCQLIWKTFHNTFTNLARRSSDKSKSVPLDYNEQNALQDRKIISSLSRCQPAAASLLAGKPGRNFFKYYHFIYHYRYGKIYKIMIVNFGIISLRMNPGSFHGKRV